MSFLLSEAANTLQILQISYFLPISRQKKFPKLKHITLYAFDLWPAFQGTSSFINNGRRRKKVNNAGVLGANADPDAFNAAVAMEIKGINVDWSKIWSQNYELAEAAVRTNYYGAKALSQILIPLLQLSESPKIINISSILGKLERLPDGWAKEVLSDVENLTEEKIDDVLNRFLEDMKENSLETKGWPAYLSGYMVSRVASNGYTRILAKKQKSFCINAYHPGFVKTDMTYNAGKVTADEGAQGAVRLALLPNASSPSGLFFRGNEEFSF
ncbi:hypothetical protein L6164_003842 [Bauhinia variegata]|uniref:Uncharacterized protein n=1 Tax=Bauhinia variegata TaxID=167791 RepID=A0ACB9Q4J9_BAUVA|nr:hypothetical protein L6164_003842 [Bauhinia variegata]